MSFFRNLRSSITRGRSTSRDTTPVRHSRPGSVVSSLNSSGGKRRDSIESRSDSVFNRSETFILDEPQETPCHSNCSTLEKKSKKSKVLEKFSTFTKRKKTPPGEGLAFEHHPSDNATNTYYKWQAEGCNSLDYDSQNDPFNFLYEQQSSLKSLQDESLKSASSTGFDSSTFRKGKMPADLKKQLKLLKDQDIHNNKENEALKLKEQKTLEEEQDLEDEEDRDLNNDKFKTITLNSFRRSFREKFLQKQKEEAAHNPSWFVEVEPKELTRNPRDPRESSKENRRDLLVFQNENYRPGSRSPIRELNNRSKPQRNNTRSPVKRNDTFKVERLSRLDQQHLNKNKPEENSSIRIEFKNSIMPHIPGRMVPVGVAKPMQNSHYYQKPEMTNMNSSYTIKSGNTTTTRLNNHSPIRSPWLEPSTKSPIRNPNNISNSQPNRYQTLVQIKNDKLQQSSPVTNRNSRLSTRVQLNGNNNSIMERKTSYSPSVNKTYKTTHITNHGSRSQHLKQTYFGETTHHQHNGKLAQTPAHLSSSTNGLRSRALNSTPASYGGYRYQASQPTSSTLFASASTLTSPTVSHSVRSTPSHSVSNIHSVSNNNLSYLKHYQQQPQTPHLQSPHQHHQTRITVSGQRRSRSPIKIPWR